jgi:UDP-N-acetylmuramate dehydrogenase
VGYRHVELKGGGEEWFVSGAFVFERGDEAASMRRMRELLSKRVASQPLNQPNAGSVFRNPPDDHAARLIEHCGLKGLTLGGAQVSRKHANFIVNVGGATAADIESLVNHVQGEVLKGTGVALIREVRIVGEGP